MFKKYYNIRIPDIDECAPNPCQNGGTCTDKVNAYTCNCLAGYQGTNCETSKYITMLEFYFDYSDNNVI